MIVTSRQSLTTSNRFPNGLSIPGGNPDGQCYQTPKPLFEKLHSVFHFTVDACASKENALLPKYWSAEDDALQKDWSTEVVFCNPPFNNIGPFLAKAWTAKRAVVLAPLNYLTSEPLHRCPPDFVDGTEGLSQVLITGSKTTKPVLGTAFLIYGPAQLRQSSRRSGGVCFSSPTLGRFLGGVFHADALDLLQKLPTDSIDAVLSDTMFGSNSTRAEYDWGKDPSGGDPEKHWDYHKPIYEECQRVSKPGGVLAWSISLKNADLATHWFGEHCPWALLRVGRCQKTVSGHLWIVQTKERKPIDPPPGHNPVVFCDRLPKTGNPPHPCPKPPEELAVLVKALTKPGRVILDPFCGTGSTLVAAEQLGRLWIGGDRSENYCKIAMRELARLRRRHRIAPP